MLECICDICGHRQKVDHNLRKRPDSVHGCQIHIRSAYPETEPLSLEFSICGSHRCLTELLDLFDYHLDKKP